MEDTKLRHSTRCLSFLIMWDIKYLKRDTIIMGWIRLRKVQKKVHVFWIIFLPKIYRIKTKQARFSYNLSQHLIAGRH